MPFLEQRLANSPSDYPRWRIRKKTWHLTRKLVYFLQRKIIQVQNKVTHFCCFAMFVILWDCLIYFDFKNMQFTTSKWWSTNVQRCYSLLSILIIWHVVVADLSCCERQVVFVLKCRYKCHFWLHAMILFPNENCTFYSRVMAVED